MRYPLVAVRGRSLKYFYIWWNGRRDPHERPRTGTNVEPLERGLERDLQDDVCTNYRSDDARCCGVASPHGTGTLRMFLGARLIGPPFSLVKVAVRVFRSP